MKRVLVVVACMASGGANAGIYKCKDAQGAIKIQDKPCVADAALPVPRLLPAPPAAGGEPPPAQPTQTPEVLYRIDPATGHLVPVTAPPPAPEPPKGNWDRYADLLEKERREREAGDRRTATDNEAAVAEIRRKQEEYDKRMRAEEEQRERQKQQNDAAYQRLRTPSQPSR